MPATAETMKTAGPKERQRSRQNQQQQQRQQEQYAQHITRDAIATTGMLAAVGTPATPASQATLQCPIRKSNNHFGPILCVRSDNLSIIGSAP